MKSDDVDLSLVSTLPSTEPERVDQITTGLFGRQSGTSWTQGHSQITLLGGADKADDAAWFRVDGAFELVFSSDYVRGSEFLLFQLGVLTHYDIGYYLAGANISDIAAMGGQPIALTSVVRYPKGLEDSKFLAIMRGIRDCCAAYGCLNVGGDIGTAERIILSASAVGVTSSDRTLTRSGARPGDRVVLSAPTGIALAAMIYFEGKQNRGWRLDDEHESRLARMWQRVAPEVSLGRLLSEKGIATSCQDTSDGLRATIEQVEAKSGVNIDIDLSAVPVDDSVAAVAELAGLSPLDIVFGGSVDFRLLFTVRGDALSDVPDSAFVIGSVTATSDSSRRLPGTTWAHQVDPLEGYRAAE